MAVKLLSVIVPELIKQFKDMDQSFLEPIKSYNDKVYNDTINFTEIGADPNVLVDNAVYPIAVNGRTDDNRPVSLHKFDTENTKVTDDELFALAYDKKSSVRKQHLESIMRTFIKLGAWSLSPASDAVSGQPVIKTTGALDGIRKRLLAEDLIALKDAWDTLEIPLEGRVLPLCTKHVNDLMLIDQSFRDRYHNTATGKLISNISGFAIYETLHAPKFKGTDYTKKAFGSVGAGTDVNFSPAYHTQNCMKALGSTSAYYRDAASDPENRQSVIGFRQFGIVSSVTTKGIAGIVDTYVP